MVNGFVTLTVSSKTYIRHFPLQFISQEDVSYAVVLQDKKVNFETQSDVSWSDMTFIMIGINVSYDS